MALVLLDRVIKDPPGIAGFLRKTGNRLRFEDLPECLPGPVIQMLYVLRNLGRFFPDQPVRGEWRNNAPHTPAVRRGGETISSVPAPARLHQPLPHEHQHQLVHRVLREAQPLSQAGRTHLAFLAKRQLNNGLNRFFLPDIHRTPP